MSKMKVSGTAIKDVGELMQEIEEELTNRDSFDTASDYDRGMRDAYRWVRNKLRSMPEIPVIRKGEIIYERMG